MFSSLSQKGEVDIAIFWMEACCFELIGLGASIRWGIVNLDDGDKDLTLLSFFCCGGAGSGENDKGEHEAVLSNIGMKVCVSGARDCLSLAYVS